MQVKVGPAVDRITFVLAPPTAWPAPSAVDLSAVRPPFVADPSGLPLAVAGRQWLLLRFSGMELADAGGSTFYTGPDRFTEPGPGLRAVVLRSEYEGVISWIVGYDAGCASATSSSSSITIAIAHS